MKRRDIVLALLALGAANWPLATLAQRPAKLFRVGTLTIASDTTYPRLGDVFLQGLRDLGYIEGRNIVFERRYAEGNVVRLLELAADLVRQKVDVIVATGGPESRAAKNATRTIPIVIVTTGDPVGGGFAASLARPGGNVTGTSTSPVEMIFQAALAYAALR